MLPGRAPSPIPKPCCPAKKQLQGCFPVSINRTYDRYGREQQVRLNTDYRLTYSYDNTGRICPGSTGGLMDMMARHATAIWKTPICRLVTPQTIFPSAIVMSRTATSEPRFPTQAMISCFPQYEYEYDRLGRRTLERQSGAAFDRAGHFPSMIITGIMKSRAAQHLSAPTKTIKPCRCRTGHGFTNMIRSATASRSWKEQCFRSTGPTISTNTHRPQVNLPPP